MSTGSQLQKAQAFRALHAGDGFVIPNPWDAGTARLLAAMGFEALATTSAGFSFSKGRADKAVPRAPVMVHLAEVVAATELPVSADLENGFGDSPQEVARTIALAAEAGVVGGSIEDATGRTTEPLYGIAHAVERIRAAVEAARALPFPFTLTARAENFFIGRPDLRDTIARLQAYQDAGADVLYAPGLTQRADIATVLREIDRPLNVLIGLPGMSLDAPQLMALGVRRVSVGGSLARAALGAFMRAATELREQGSAAYAQEAPSGRALNRLLGDPPPR